MMVQRLMFVVALALGASVTVVTLALPEQALAAKKKAKKASKKGAEEAEADAQKAQAEAEERKAPARFEWSSRGGEVDMDVRADQKRDEAILKLKKLLPTVTEGPQKAELVFRLSEMYWAKAKFKHLRAMQIWDEQLQKWHDAGEKGAQPVLDKIAETDEADLFKRSALKLYEEILDKYPDYPRKDEVLYNLGSSMYESGDKKRGVEMYWKLIKQFPGSDFSADAWLQLGEHFFNSNKLPEAVKAYSKAAETKKPRIYSFALYKLAWCDYNLGEYEGALKKFRGVVEYAKTQKGKSGSEADINERDRIQLVDEALSDMVRTYSHLDAVDDAFEYYAAEVGKDKSYRYMKKLGELYNGEGKWALEIRTYEKLNTSYPYAPEAPQNQTAIMNAYAQLGKNDMVRKEARRLIDLYSPTGTWAKRNEGNKDVLESAFDTVEQELAALVTEQHRAAQQTKLVETYQLARDVYKEYLDNFTDSVNSYKFRFFYSEILFELKQFREAAAEYDRVVEANKKGEFAKHAAYASILSWEKVVSGVKETLGKKIEEDAKRSMKAQGKLAELEKLKALEKGKKYDETPLSGEEQSLASACDRFVEVAPNDEEVVKVKFKSARLYYIHNQFEPAAARFGEIIDRWPKDSLARLSAESIVMSFNVREDWTNLNKWARQFQGNKLLMGDKEFAKTIHEFVEGASFNEVHFVYEPKETPEQIADRYTAFVTEFPRSKYAMVGLYNAIVNYDKSNLLEKSIARAQQMLKEYKDFKISDEELEKSKREGSTLPKPEEIREKTLFLAASFWERLAEFDKAADLYEQYAAEFKSGPKRADAVFNAGLFREGLGQLDKAIESFTRYITDYSGKDDVTAIAWRIGTIHEKKKDYKAAQSYFAGFGKYAKGDQGRQLCADFRVLEALDKQGKAKEAKAMFGDILASYKKLPEAKKQEPCALEAVAAVGFRLLEPEFEAYKAIPLASVPEKQMAQNLIKKLELVDQLQNKYTDVLKLGQGDYGIAALYHIGLIYQHLAKAIFDTPCPKRLDDDQCAIYQAALQEKAFPLEEKAIEAFDKALGKAYELGLYNSWLAKAQEALRIYEPGRFPEVHEYDLIASQSVFEVPMLVQYEAKQPAAEVKP